MPSKLWVRLGGPTIACAQSVLSFSLNLQACLKCVACQRTLDAVRLLEHDGDPYCKPCHTSAFGIEVRG